MSKWLQDTLTWMRTLPRHEPDDAAPDGYEGPPVGEVVYHHVQAPEVLARAPARPTPRTPLHVVRAMVEAKKAEMATEREGRAIRNRILSEYAADAAHAVEVKPGPYDVALGREINADLDLDLYDVLLPSAPSTGEHTAELSPPPCPYDEPVRQLRERDRMREANR